MNTTEFGGYGHGMPCPEPASVAKKRQAKEAAKRKKQAEDFAKNSLPTEETTTTTIHESKTFPFQIVEITTTQGKKEAKQFRIGMLGEFVSHKVFKTKETAEKYISNRPWELITNLVCLTFKNAFEYEKSKS